jgi:hypothetical protein
VRPVLILENDLWMRLNGARLHPPRIQVPDLAISVVGQILTALTSWHQGWLYLFL